MSLIAYLTAGEYDGSAWLRDRLKMDGLRAQMEPLDLGIKTEHTGQGGKFVAEDQMDPVLRFHCRVVDREDGR